MITFAKKIRTKNITPKTRKGNNKMKEFNVRVESTNDMRVVGREEAIKEAKRQIKNLIEAGYTKNQVWCSFYHETTGEHLGNVELVGGEEIQLLNVDNRIATLKALLS